MFEHGFWVKKGSSVKHWSLRKWSQRGPYSRNQDGKGKGITLSLVFKTQKSGGSKRLLDKMFWNLWRWFSCNTQLNRISHHHRMFLRIQEDFKRQWKSPEGEGPWEVIKCCGKDASFPSGNASIMNCQQLGEYISKKSLSSCLVHLIISLNVFCSLLETGYYSEGFWNRQPLTLDITSSFLVNCFL